ncbi:MAG: LemA family protein [Alphaproteobacteria bacterium]|nr:LemA family protein [Alphaproteobacteria bacterium]
MLTWIILIVAALLLYVMYGYNKGISCRNYVQEAFATMDVYLKKRWDLVPNLIECVKSYSQYEKSLLNELTALRTKEYSTLSNNEKIDANQQLGQVLSKITAVAENYPDLKANQTYTTLMQQMEGVEDDIAQSRKYYNGTVRELNTFLEAFPSNLIGKLFGFEKAKMYTIDENERANIKVEL